MATRNLTQNVDNLTGTSNPDLFNAPLFTSTFGAQSSTLQTGDRLNGGAGTDRLVATLLADGNELVQAYFARPLLTSIETVQVTSLSGNSGSNDQSPSTLDFLQSTGIKTFVSESSNNFVQVRNAGDIASYKVRNTVADPADNDGLAVTGISRSDISITADNVFAANPENAQTLSFDTRSGADFRDVLFTVTDSQVRLDADVTGTLKLASGGASGSNDVTLLDDSYTRLLLRGSGDLEVSTSGNEGTFTLGTSFDASAMTGALTVDSDISGDLTVVRGSQGNDTFADITSSTAGTFAVALNGGTNSVESITSDTASSVRVTGGSGADTIDYIEALAVSINLGSGNDTLDHVDLEGAAASNVVLGAGNDAATIHMFDAGSVTVDGGAGRDSIVIDQFGQSTGNVTIASGDGSDVINVDMFQGALSIDAGANSDQVYITSIATGVNNSVQMGANSDLLDISDITPDLLSTVLSPTFDTFDGGTGDGTDRIVVDLAGISAEQGTHIVNFETLDLVGDSTGEFDLGTGLATITTINADQGIGQDLNFTNVTNAVTFNLHSSGNVQTDFVDSPVPGHVLDVNLSETIPGDITGTNAVSINLDLNSDTATLNLSSLGTDAGAGNILNLIDQDGLSSIIIDGGRDLSIGTDPDFTGSDLTSVNASALTGDLNMTAGYNGGTAYAGLGISGDGATVTGGSGNDTLIGGAGADVFNLSAGGTDTIVYKNSLDSDLALNSADTVNNFVSHGANNAPGADTLVFNNVYSAGSGSVFSGATGDDVTAVVNGSGAVNDITTLNFLGNAVSFAEAQAAIATFHTGNAEDYAAVFDRSSSTLYVDANHDGSLTQADMQINVAGLGTSGLSFNDLGLTTNGIV
ncbi:hypothetical protein [Methylobacterium sp. 77]|uniref:beta strand repeat-containing protein n=1 Tax=Methylobacterium sp. 77 TaxID=1101192 RepID=UPI00036BBE68|nr:hypothetical protein [Methylobacterium sp. 77]